LGKGRRSGGPWGVQDWAHWEKRDKKGLGERKARCLVIGLRREARGAVYNS